MNKTFDQYASVVFLVVGVAIYLYAQTLTVSNVGIAIGPKALPSFLAVILIILSSINLFVTIRSQTLAKKEELEYKKFLIILVSLILYALLIETLGYVISTFLFLMVGFQTMEKGKYLSSAVIAAAFAGGIYYFYVELFLGVLPPLPF
ncbi:tripartite tricarboxylate transporter TctB family protein [Sporomusa sp.]|uniref:tripartite tricarboxylate transporter TctB family protein n=1 Tax=Sporomusa sp. TaxID=2078658 RepID=UPI002BE5168D|nr:tripartite tricarboxylate transporter TctB family protein [Sporomusa sp.]HWR09992.1 tripartite tricarboxylate transporter TctB family protein [Sporomusa sp.]